MNFKFEQIAALVLLAVILGLVTVNVHAASHLSGTAVDCKLCPIYSDQPIENNGQARGLNVSARTVFSCEHPPKSTENEVVRRLFARGPPKLTG
jgi:hypothetical protein